jgi:hypothetical protein
VYYWRERKTGHKLQIVVLFGDIPLFFAGFKSAKSHMIFVILAAQTSQWLAGLCTIE